MDTIDHRETGGSERIPRDNLRRSMFAINHLSYLMMSIKVSAKRRPQDRSHVIANYDIIRRRICPTSKSHNPKPGYAVSGYRCRKSISGIREVVIMVMCRVACGGE
jgi:hypothetical protein